MTEVNAYFYKNKIYVEGGAEYKTGEILLKYLSLKSDLENLYAKCRQYQNRLRYPETRNEIPAFHWFVEQAFMFYSTLDDLICSMPPYHHMDIKRNQLYELLNQYGWLFESEYDEEGKRLDYREKFSVDMALDEYTEADMIDSILELDMKLKSLADEYAVFIEDLLRVKKVYEPFLERIHYRSEFIPNEETAGILSEFTEQTRDTFHSYEKLQPSGMMTLSYKALKTKESPVLCERYHFTTIGAFLYIELFKGLQNHYLPKKCSYCRRYFLLEGAYFSDYCTRPVKGMKGKVCRDVGHRKKYADKIKNDPIWLTYVRAYKNHYARYLKKKMTQSEFQQWADYALNLRQQAIDEVLPFEEYQEKIKK